MPLPLFSLGAVSLCAGALEDAAPAPCAERRRFVLHVRAVSGFGGGPEKTILNSACIYRKFGYRSACAYLHRPGDAGFITLQRRAAGLGAHLVPIVDRGPLDPCVVFKLAALCQRLKVEIWHSHDYKSNLLGLILRRFHPMALVTTVHGWVEHTVRTPLYYAIDKWCLPHFDRVICVSEDLYDECRKRGVPADRCVLVLNAIDCDVYARRHERSKAKEMLNAPANSVLIGAVGRLSAEKGFADLIHVVAELRRQGRPLTLWIAGEGPARADLQRLIDECDCGDGVRLLGYVSDPALLYQALDLFVLSSHREGLPNVVLEAMAFAAPVIATRVAGVPALVEHEQTGLLIEAGNRSQMRAAIDRLCRDEPLRMRLAAAARRQVEKSFNFLERTRRVCAVHDDALATVRNVLTQHPRP